MVDPYIERNPGDLISAGDWNQMQRLIQEDIEKKTKKAINAIQQVPRAANADKLEGSSKSELIDEIVKKAVQEIRAKSGYMQLFKILKGAKENVIKHDLHLCPLVDVYQLDYFPVVCCEDKQTSAMWTTFYLYHSSEKRLRWSREEGEKPILFDIQPADGQPFRILFKDLLERYKVEYTDDSSLGDLETEFWEAFFKAPNDEFDDDQHCHSPWFDRCCREQKSVRDLKRQGDWDELWFQVRARKTINYDMPLDREGGRVIGAVPPAPSQVQVTQHDFDTIALRLLARPSYPADQLERTDPPGPLLEQFPELGIGFAEVPSELKVMVLLKV